MKRQGISGGRPVVLQLAGGFGVGPVAEIFQSILKVETPIELLVVTARTPPRRRSSKPPKPRSNIA
jgi:hypothetical protein